MSDDAVIKELGQKILANWRMLSMNCPLCSTVLVQEPNDGKRYCCKCKAFLVTQEEAKKHNLTVTDTLPDSISSSSPAPQTGNDSKQTNVSSPPSTTTTTAAPPALPTQPRPKLDNTTSTTTNNAGTNTNAKKSNTKQDIKGTKNNEKKDNKNKNATAVGATSNNKSTSPPTKQQSSSQQQPQPNFRTTQALVDADFEKEFEAEEDAAAAASEQNTMATEYNALKDMYTKLMSGSKSLFDNSGFEMGSFGGAFGDLSATMDDDGGNDIDDNDNDKIEDDNNNNDEQQVGSGFSFMSALLNTFKKDIDNSNSPGKKKEVRFDSMIDTKDNILDDKNTNNSNSTEQSKSIKHYTTPPDPDDDWEYYNSRDTDIVHEKDNIIDKDAFKLSEEEFAAFTLQGWIFSSHACQHCEQILLFPPSSSFTPEDLHDDIITRYNKTLHYNYKNNSNTNNNNIELQPTDVDLDSCEFIHALCTYCGWYCITDDEYVPTLKHECCSVANGVDIKTVAEMASVNTPTTTTSTTTPATSATSATKSNNNDDDEEDWSKRIQKAMDQAIADQTKGNYNDYDELDAEDYDYHNFHGLEETAKLLNSDDMKEKVDHLNVLSGLLSTALSQGKLLLDEYCPDCIIPLVGLITQEEYDNITIQQQKNVMNNVGGMKIQYNKYATMPKECVLCQMTWNVNTKLDNKNDTISTKPTTTTTTTSTTTNPQQTLPSYQIPQPSNQQHKPPALPARPTRPSFVPSPQQQQSYYIPSSPSVNNHLQVLYSTLDVITAKIQQANQDLIDGKQSQPTLLELLTLSRETTQAIVQCKGAF